MSDFENTVAKIAASPWKRAAMREIPGFLYKQAYLGSSKPVRYLLGDTGAQEIAKNLVSAGVMGLGGYTGARLMGQLDDSQKKIESRYSTLGKLEAEQRFKNHQIKKLRPLQDRTYSEIQSDPILAKADPTIIESSYNTMRRIAPTLAADPNAARAFLRNTALYGTGPDYATLKTLADTESSVARTYAGD